MSFKAAETFEQACLHPNSQLVPGSEQEIAYRKVWFTALHYFLRWIIVSGDLSPEEFEKQLQAVCGEVDDFIDAKMSANEIVRTQ